MRSTKASNAVERLNKRWPDRQHSMVRGGDGHFHLVEVDEQGQHKRLCDPMEQDDFVRFVNGLGPQKVEKRSKLDQEFEARLKNRRQPGG